MSQEPQEDFKFEEQSPKPGKRRTLMDRMTPAKRYILVAGIVLCLVVPLLFVRDLIFERMSLYHSAVESIADLWGRKQIVRGPLLIIPVELTEMEKGKLPDGTTQWVPKIVSRFVVVLPNQFTAKAELLPEERIRGVYRYTVYTSNVTLNGVFTLPEVFKNVNKWNGVQWGRAFIAFGIQDPRGLEDIQCVARFSGPSSRSGELRLPAEPGTGLAWLNTGFHVPLPMNFGSTELSFNLSMRLNGSGGMEFAPVGEKSLIEIQSPWPHPSFQGEKLPTEREITPTGFTAKWKIPHLARSYPQSFRTGIRERSDMNYEYQMKQFTVGADLFEPVTYYSLVERATKYGILFICLTFVGIIAFEASIGTHMHPLQYGLVGLAMTIFYLILLSLAEYAGFLTAYVVASIVAISMITLYVAAALRNVLRACGIAVLLAALYVLLYALLQLEDYALLVGTGLVVCMLGVLMYITRNLGYKS